MAYVYSLAAEGGRRDVVSLLTFEDVDRVGLPPRAVVGTLTRPVAEGGRVEPANFTPNPAFVSLLHELLAVHAADDAAVTRQAASIGTGPVYLVDRRADGSAPADVGGEDVMGMVQAEAGRVVPGSYVPNPNHVLLSSRGLFRLDRALHARLLAAMRGDAPQGDAAEGAPSPLPRPGA